MHFLPAMENKCAFQFSVFLVTEFNTGFTEINPASLFVQKICFINQIVSLIFIPLSY